MLAASLIAACHIPRLSSGSMPKPPISTAVADSPVPHSTRPFDTECRDALGDARRVIVFRRTRLRNRDAHRVLASGANPTFDTRALSRLARESGHPVPAPGLNRGATYAACVALDPRFRGGDEQKMVGSICLVCTASCAAANNGALRRAAPRRRQPARRDE
jgi:hypothetical protein